MMFTQRPFKYLSETRCTPVIKRSLQGSSSIGKLLTDKAKKYVFMYMLCVMGKHALRITSADRSLLVLTALCYISQVWMENV